MGELAVRIKAKYPEYQSWSDDDLEQKFLAKYGDAEPAYKMLADEKNRIAFNNQAVKKAEQGIKAAEALPPSIPKNIIERAADVAAPYLEPLQTPATGLGMLADVLQTGGKNIKLPTYPKDAQGGVTGFLTGGARLEKSLPEQAVDTLRRRVALSATPYQYDPTKSAWENAKAAAGHAVGAATGIGTGGIGLGTGEIPGEEQHIRESFEKTHKPLAIAEAVAEPVAEMGSQMILDPAMAGMAALGNVAKAGQAEQALLRSGAALTPERAATAIAAANKGRLAGLGAGTLGAAFTPGMAGGGGSAIGAGLASLDQGRDVQAAKQLSQGAVDLGFTAFAAKNMADEAINEIRKPKAPPQVEPEGQEPPKNLLDAMREQASKKLQESRPLSDPEPERNKPAAAQGRGSEGPGEVKLGPFTAGEEGPIKAFGHELPGPRALGRAGSYAAAIPVGGLIGSAVGHPLLGWYLARDMARGPMTNLAKGLESRARQAIRSAGKPIGTEGTPDAALQALEAMSTDVLRSGMPGAEGGERAIPQGAPYQYPTVGGTSSTMGRVEMPVPENLVPETPAAAPGADPAIIALLKQQFPRTKGTTQAEYDQQIQSYYDRLAGNKENKSGRQIAEEAAAAKTAPMTTQTAPPPVDVATRRAEEQRIIAENEARKKAQIEQARAEIEARQQPQTQPVAPVEQPKKPGRPRKAKAVPAETPTGELPPIETRAATEGRALPEPQGDLLQQMIAMAGRKPEGLEAAVEQAKTKPEGNLLEQMKAYVSGEEKQVESAKEHTAALQAGTHPSNKSGLKTTELEARPEYKQVMADFNAGNLKDMHGNPITKERTAVRIAFNTADRAALKEGEAAKAATEPSLEEKLKASVEATKPATKVEKKVEVKPKAAEKPQEAVQPPQAKAQGPIKAPEGQKAPEKAPEGVMEASPRAHIKRLLDVGDYKNAAELIRKHAKAPADRVSDQGHKVGYVDRNGNIVVDIMEDGTESKLKATPKPASESSFRPGAGKQYSVEKSEGVSVKRAKSFSDDGLYDVTVDGKTHKIYRDPESGWWYLDTSSKLIADKHYSARSLGFNKAEATEAVANLVRTGVRRPAGASVSKYSVEGERGLKIKSGDWEGRYWTIKDGTQRYKMKLADGSEFSGSVKGDTLTLGHIEAEGHGKEIASVLRDMSKRLNAKKIILDSTNKLSLERQPTGSVTRKALNWRARLEAAGEGKTLPDGTFEIFLEKKGGPGGPKGAKFSVDDIREEIGASKKSPIEVRQALDKNGEDTHDVRKWAGGEEPQYTDPLDIRKVDLKNMPEGTVLEVAHYAKDTFGRYADRADDVFIVKTKDGWKAQYNLEGDYGKLKETPGYRKPLPAGETRLPESTRTVGRMLADAREAGVEGMAREQKAQVVKAELPPELKKNAYIDAETGHVVIDTPRGTIRIMPKDKIEFDMESVERGWGKEAREAAEKGLIKASGAKYTLGGEAIVEIANTGKLGHEVQGHVFLDHFANAKERDVLWKRFGVEAELQDRTVDEVVSDVILDAHKRLQADPGWQPKNAVGRWAKRVIDFFQAVRQKYFPTVESTIKYAAEGKWAGRKGGAIGEAGPEFSMGPRGAGSALGRQLAQAEGLRKGSNFDKEALYGKKDLTPRLGQKKTDVAVTEGALAPKKYSVDTVEDTIKAAEEYNKKKKVFTPEQISSYAKSLRNVAATILQDKDRLGFDALEGTTALKKNADKQRYARSLDFTTLCRRRNALYDTIDAIQAKTGKTLSSEEIINVRKSLQDAGHEVNCGPCYVDSRRINMKTVLDKAREELPPKYRDMVLTQEGRDRLMTEAPEEYKKLSKAFAGTQIKIPVGRTAYRGEILDLQKPMVDRMNRFSGLRSQSWSDFEVPHLLDKMQAVYDMALRGLKGHSYTKELDYVHTMKDTGEAINMSLIPEGTGFNKDGKLAFNQGESIRDIAEAKKIRAKYDNVGFEAIGISDAHIKAMLADPNVDYVIPYHTSGLRSEFQHIGKMRNWTDYTDNAHWTDAKTKELVSADREIPVDEWKGDLKKLDKLAKERGVVPPFQQFKNLPGYEKLLVDRRIWDANHKFIEQRPVEFKFDMDQVNRMLGEYKGEHKQGSAVQSVVDEYTKGKPQGLSETTAEVSRYHDAQLKAIEQFRKRPEQQTPTARALRGWATRKENEGKKFSIEEDTKLGETSGNTAISRGDASAAAKAWADQVKDKTVFDWGAGKGADLPFYKKAGAKEVKGYDPNHMPTKPEGMADVVTSTYVGNVLPPTLRHEHWQEAYQRAKEKMLVTVRNEVPEGVRKYEDGVIVKQKGQENFQRAYTQQELLDELKGLFPNSKIEAGPKLSSGVTAVVNKPTIELSTNEAIRKRQQEWLNRPAPEPIAVPKRKPIVPRALVAGGGARSSGFYGTGVDYSKRR